MTTTCRTCQGRKVIYNFRIIDGALVDKWTPCPDCNAGGQVQTQPAIGQDVGDGLPANYARDYVGNK